MYVQLVYYCHVCFDFILKTPRLKNFFIILQPFQEINGLRSCRTRQIPIYRIIEQILFSISIYWNRYTFEISFYSRKLWHLDAVSFQVRNLFSIILIFIVIFLFFRYYFLINSIIYYNYNIIIIDNILKNNLFFSLYSSVWSLAFLVVHIINF